MSYPVERQHRRYRLAVAVEYGSSRGLTRDVSVGGIYFVISEQVEAGSSIRFSLVFTDQSKPPLRIECDGTVIRVDHLMEGVGVAATIDCFESIVAAIERAPSRQRI